jgi:hypothetical protein
LRVRGGNWDTAPVFTWRVLGLGDLESF